MRAWYIIVAQRIEPRKESGCYIMVSFASDYQEGAHPSILERMCATNLNKMPGYGTDEICEAARNKIRAAIDCQEADVHFLVGGTQTNAIVIGALLAPYQGVIAPESGHISQHEAGAIEAGGHKVLALPHRLGKLDARTVRDCCASFWDDGNHDHMVFPGMVYLSQPTEYGTLYSLSELAAIREVCDEYDLPLYVDGARLAYALACKQNDVSLADLARLCDVFYLGGTKCGALFGEAVVVPNPTLLPHFFTTIKQRGALLAKGWLLGIQFDELFANNLYLGIGKPAIRSANTIRARLAQAGYELAFDSPTNQVFVALTDDEVERLKGKVAYSFWERRDDGRTIVRLASSWATTEEQTLQLLKAFAQSVARVR